MNTVPQSQRPDSTFTDLDQQRKYVRDLWSRARIIIPTNIIPNN